MTIEEGKRIFRANFIPITAVCNPVKRANVDNFRLSKQLRPVLLGQTRGTTLSSVKNVRQRRRSNYRLRNCIHSRVPLVRCPSTLCTTTKSVAAATLLDETLLALMPPPSAGGAKLSSLWSRWSGGAIEPQLAHAPQQDLVTDPQELGCLCPMASRGL